MRLAGNPLLRLAAVLAATLALVAVAAPATANARTLGCSLRAPGAPVADGDAVTSTGYAQCGFHWRIVGQLQIEQDGYWTSFVTSSGRQVKHRATPMHRPGQRAQITFSWRGLDVTPCSVNMRVIAWAVNPYGAQEGPGSSSPVTHRTCRGS